MKISKLYTLSFLLVAMGFTSLQAQEAVSVKATVDKNTILIGEQFYFQVEATLPLGQPYTILKIDSIPHFEVLHAEEPEEKNIGDVKQVIQKFLLTSFDSGHWVIPSFRIAAEVYTDTIAVDVVFSEFDPAQDYHDIKDVLDVKPEAQKKKLWYWYAAAGAVLLAVAVYFLARKKKPAVLPAVSIDAYDEAKKQLAALEKENADARMFYTKLVDIFRLYVLRKKGIASLQKTTDDLVLQLRSLNLPEENYRTLAQALRLSDFVKFAKYQPTDLDNKASFLTIKNSIAIIESSLKMTGNQH